MVLGHKYWTCNSDIPKVDDVSSDFGSDHLLKIKAISSCRTLGENLSKVLMWSMNKYL